MFGSSKFNKSNNDEEEINKAVEKYDVDEKELEQGKARTSAGKNIMSRPLRPTVTKKTEEESSGTPQCAGNRPNIYSGRPSINRNSGYNKSNKSENTAKEEDISLSQANNSVNPDDFIKEEEVADRKLSPRPVLNRQSKRNNGNYKHTYSSKNEYLNEDNKMAANGLPLRLDKLIDVVSDHQGLDAKNIKEIKKKALLNPESMMKEYENIFRNEIKPNMENRHRTLEDARKQHPDKIVFMFVKDGRQVFKALDKDKANGYEAYDGLVIETVSSSRTPFGPANVVFAKDEPELVEDADDAFDENKSNDASEQSPTENQTSDSEVNVQENVGFEDDVDLNAKPPSNAFKV